MAIAFADARRSSAPHALLVAVGDGQVQHGLARVREPRVVGHVHELRLEAHELAREVPVDLPPRWFR